MNEDFLLNEEFKSDKYEISINELMFGRIYKPTISSVQKLLDDNGYFGRSRVEIVKNKKFGTDTLIKVHIYLYDSAFEYTWPFNTFFDLDTKSYGHNRRLSRGVFTDNLTFVRLVTMLAYMFTPQSKLEKPLSDHVKELLEIRKIIDESNLPADDWPWAICSYKQIYGPIRKRWESIIHFLKRTGFIVNNRSRLISALDAQEICDNLFDINYWSNI